MSNVDGPTIKIFIPPPEKPSASSELKKFLSLGNSSSGTGTFQQGHLQFKNSKKMDYQQGQGPPTAVFGVSSSKQARNEGLKVTKISTISEHNEQESMIRVSQKQEPLKIIHDKELVISNLSSIPGENSIEMINEFDLDGIRDTNMSSKSKKGNNLHPKQEKTQHLNESVATPTFNSKQQAEFPHMFKPSMSSFNPAASKLQSQRDQHKIRLRDYLFMVNTSAQAAAKKRTKDLQENKSLFIEQAQLQQISRCQSDASIGINNRYHSEKYKINNLQIGTLLKKDVRDEIVSLRENLKELQEFVDETCEHLSQKDIAVMLQLRRFLETSNQKGKQLIFKMKIMNPPMPDHNISNQSVVLVKVPGEDKPVLKQPPLIGTFHKKQLY